jgi:hypothetical protein
VEEGQEVTVIQAGGSWSRGPDDQWVDANGLSEAGLREDGPMPDAFGGQLIGRVGEQEDLLALGRWHTFESPASGPLYLAMNDSDYDDNDGYITVQIIVEQDRD